MRIIAMIRKLLNAYTVWEILEHLANELDQCAAHFDTAGAPKRAAYLRNEAAMLRECKAKIAKIEY